MLTLYLGLVAHSTGTIAFDDICEIKKIIELDLNKLREIKELVGDTPNSNSSSNYTEQINRYEESIVRMYGIAERICTKYHVLRNERENNRIGFEEYFQYTGELMTEKATLMAEYKLKASILMDRLQRTLKGVSEKIPKDNQKQIKDILAAKGLKNYYKNSHAFIIGISEYQDENPLPNAYNDAIGIERVLKEKYEFDNFITLYSKNATKQKIEEIFEDMVPNRQLIDAEDRVLIYYSGHGKLRSSTGFQGEAQKTGYIVPYDAQKDKTSTYIDMDRIVKSCQNCIAKHILLILDCCYSGYAALRISEPQRPTSDTASFLKDVTDRRTIQVIAAGREDQPVNDSGIRQGLSAFTGALLDILEIGKDLNDDGILSASEVGSYLEKEVARHAMGIAQKPVYNHLSGSNLGDFVFGILKQS